MEIIIITIMSILFKKILVFVFYVKIYKNGVGVKGVGQRPQQFIPITPLATYFVWSSLK